MIKLKTRHLIARFPPLAEINSDVAGVEGLEPPTLGFGDRCSSQLSYTPSSELYKNSMKHP
jgi:hypothetical protein